MVLVHLEIAEVNIVLFRLQGVESSLLRIGVALMITLLDSYANYHSTSV